MGTLATMTTLVTGFCTKITTLFAKTAGGGGNALFFDNNEGSFAFVNEPLVSILQIATTAAELVAVKAAIQADPVLAGDFFADATTLKIWHWDGSAWTQTTADYYNHVRLFRVYYSPYSQRVWCVDKYGDFKRFMTTGLTVVG